MISKLPSWIWPGAWILAFMAGIINVVGLLSFEHQPVTHLTGTTSLLAAALSRFDGSAIARLAGVIGAFVLGAIASGYLVQNESLRLGRRYVLALLCEGVILVVSIPYLNHQSMVGIYGAAAACGLQNAMISTYSGAIVRTTHVSGMFTDLGIALGHALRGLPVDHRRLTLCAIVICGFLAGGGLGALSFRLVHYYALTIPAVLSVLCAGLVQWIHHAAGDAQAPPRPTKASQTGSPHSDAPDES